MRLSVNWCEDDEDATGEELRNNLGELLVLRNEDAADEDATAPAPAWCSAKMERPCTVAVSLGRWNVEQWKTLHLSPV